MLGDTLKALVNYAGALKVEYRDKLVNWCIKDADDGTLFFEYEPPTIRATNEQYIRFANLCMNGISLLPLVESSWAESGRGRNLEVMHAKCSVLNIIEHAGMELMVGAADYFIKNHNQGTLVHGKLFYSVSKSTLEDLYKGHKKFALEVHSF